MVTENGSLLDFSQHWSWLDGRFNVNNALRDIALTAGKPQEREDLLSKISTGVDANPEYWSKARDELLNDQHRLIQGNGRDLLVTITNRINDRLAITREQTTGVKIAPAKAGAKPL